MPLRPTTPYAVSKIGQDLMGYQYFAQYGLPVVRVRPFNHTGPGQDSRFVIPSFARQLAEIEAGEREAVLRVGNLEVERDFTDVILGLWMDPAIKGYEGFRDFKANPPGDRSVLTSAGACPT